MFANAKYIVVAMGYSEYIFPFSPSISHKDMFNMVGGEIVSAGFIDEFMQCYGSSASLNISSREKDTILLKVLFQLQDKKIDFV